MRSWRSRERAAGETISATLRDHADMGDTVRVIAGIFFVLLLAWVLFDRWRAKVGDERRRPSCASPGWWASCSP